MKKLTFLGAGSAFTMQNRQSNLLLESKSGKKLLIDAGTDIRHSLSLLGYDHLDLDGVYISHCHGDHVGGLEWLGFLDYFDPRVKERPKMFINDGLTDVLWDNVLKGGMRSLQGSIATLDTYFDVRKVKSNESFEWEGTKFQLVQTVHIVDGFSFQPSYGLMFEVNGKRYFFTSDTQHAPSQLNDFYNMSDVIFNDCETSPYPSGVHANFKELTTLSEETKNKMWLYHYNDGDLPDAEKYGFAGFVNKGQVFEF
jgi:ribonuclease BN (tRNA processing enzyme)